MSFIFRSAIFNEVMALEFVKTLSDPKERNTSLIRNLGNRESPVGQVHDVEEGSVALGIRIPIDVESVTRAENFTLEPVDGNTVVLQCVQHGERNIARLC